MITKIDIETIPNKLSSTSRTTQLTTTITTGRSTPIKKKNKTIIISIENVAKITTNIPTTTTSMTATYKMIKTRTSTKGKFVME